MAAHSFCFLLPNPEQQAVQKNILYMDVSSSYTAHLQAYYEGKRKLEKAEVCRANIQHHLSLFRPSLYSGTSVNTSFPYNVGCICTEMKLLTQIVWYLANI